jgi:hypothetical protein
MPESYVRVLSVKVPEAMRGDLEFLAASNDRTVSAEVRQALRLHLRLADVGGAPGFPPSMPVERRAPVSGPAEAPAHTGLEQPDG